MDDTKLIRKKSIANGVDVRTTEQFCRGLVTPEMVERFKARYRRHLRSAYPGRDDVQRLLRNVYDYYERLLADDS